MANGYTSAERSANAKKQLRDKKGRWVEMGGGVKFMLNGEWVAGTVTGIHPDSGNVTVELTSGKYKGHKATQSAKKLETIQKKATIPEKGGAPKSDAFKASEGKVWTKPVTKTEPAKKSPVWTPPEADIPTAASHGEPITEDVSLEFYASDGYIHLNSSLRMSLDGKVKNPDLQVHVDNLDKLIDGHALPEAKKLYRGVWAKEADKNPDGSSWIDDLQVGGTFTDKGFVSVTDSQETAFTFAGQSQGPGGKPGSGAVMMFDMPAGSKALDVVEYTKKNGTYDAEYAEEKETILPRGQAYEITEVDEVDGVKFIYARPATEEKQSDGEQDAADTGGAPGEVPGEAPLDGGPAPDNAAPEQPASADLPGGAGGELAEEPALASFKDPDWQEKWNSLAADLGVSPQELYSDTQKYTTPTWYRDMNQRLRVGTTVNQPTGKIDKLNKNVAAVVNAHTPAEPVTVYRGVHFAKPGEGNVVTEAFQKALDDGTPLSDLAFVSTTTNKSWGEHYANRQGAGGFLLELNLKPGDTALDMQGLRGKHGQTGYQEHEYVLPPGAKIKLESVEDHPTKKGVKVVKGSLMKENDDDGANTGADTGADTGGEGAGSPGGAPGLDTGRADGGTEAGEGAGDRERSEPLHVGEPSDRELAKYQTVVQQALTDQERKWYRELRSELAYLTPKIQTYDWNEKSGIAMKQDASWMKKDTPEQIKKNRERYAKLNGRIAKLDAKVQDALKERLASDEPKPNMKQYKHGNGYQGNGAKISAGANANDIAFVGLKYGKDDALAAHLNGALRHNGHTVAVDPHVNSVADGLFAATQKSKLKDDSVLYRAAMMSPEQVSRLTPGDVYIDHGFVSTTKVPHVAEQYLANRKKYAGGKVPVMVRIEAPKGSKAVDITAHKGFDREVVFANDTEFEVKSVSWNDDEQRADLVLGVKSQSGQKPRLVADYPQQDYTQLPPASVVALKHRAERQLLTAMKNSDSPDDPDVQEAQLKLDKLNAEIQHNAERKKFEILDDDGASGDGFYEDTNFWGQYGAAGVFTRHVDKKGNARYLLMQRNESGGKLSLKWQLPGGALNEAENDYQGAARELSEELFVSNKDVTSLKPVNETRFDHESGWHYTSLMADSPKMFDVSNIDEHEANDAKWLTADEIMELKENGDLHPVFADSVEDLLKGFDTQTIVPDKDIDTPDAADLSSADLDAPDADELDAEVPDDSFDNVMALLDSYDLENNLQSFVDEHGGTPAGKSAKNALDAIEDLAANSDTMTPEERAHVAQNLKNALDDVDADIDQMLDNDELEDQSTALDIQNAFSPVGAAVEDYHAAQVAKQSAPAAPEVPAEAAPSPSETPSASAPAVPAGTIGTDSEGKKYVSDANGSPIYVGSTVTSKTDGLTGTVKTIEGNGNYVKVIGPDGKVKGRKISTLETQDATPQPASPGKTDIAPESTPEASGQALSPDAKAAEQELDGLDVSDGLDETMPEDMPVGSKILVVDTDGDSTIYTKTNSDLSGLWDVETISKDGESNANGKPEDQADWEMELTGGFVAEHPELYPTIKIGLPKSDTGKKDDDSVTGEVIDVTGDEKAADLPIGTVFKQSDPTGALTVHFTKEAPDKWSSKSVYTDGPTLPSKNVHSDSDIQEEIKWAPKSQETGDVGFVTITLPADKKADESNISELTGQEAVSDMPAGTVIAIDEPGGVGATSTYTKNEDGSWSAEMKDSETGDVVAESDSLDAETVQDAVDSVPDNKKNGYVSGATITYPEGATSQASTKSVNSIPPGESAKEAPAGTKYTFVVSGPNGGITTVYSKEGPNSWTAETTDSNGDKSPKSSGIADDSVQLIITAAEDKDTSPFSKADKTVEDIGGTDPNNYSDYLGVQSADNEPIFYSDTITGIDEDGSEYTAIGVVDGKLQLINTDTGDDYPPVDPSFVNIEGYGLQHNQWKNDNPSGLMPETLAETKTPVTLEEALNDIGKASAPEVPKVPLGTVGTDASGKKYVSDSKGNPIYVGSKVTSLTDGLTGTVKTIEGNGTHVKVIGPDGKIKGRKITTLTTDSLEAPKPAGNKANPYVPTAAPVEEKPFSTEVGDLDYNPLQFAGEDANMYNDQQLYTNSAVQPPAEADVSSPLFGTPQPTAPKKPAELSANVLSDEWLQAVKDNYLKNPNRKKDSLEQSMVWPTVQSAVKTGSKEKLDKLRKGKYIGDTLHKSALEQIDAAEKARAGAKKSFDDAQKKYQQDLADWKAVNVTASQSPTVFPHMPEPSSKPFFGGEADWTAAHPGTVSLDSALTGMTGNKNLARTGLSVAVDGHSVEGMDLHLRHIKDKDGNLKLQARFKLTSRHGDALAKTLATSGAPKTSKIGIHSSKLNQTGLVTYSDTYKYEFPGNQWTLSGDNYTIRFQRTKGETTATANALHNSVDIQFSPDATPQDVQKALEHLKIKGTPASEGDIRVFTENKLMSVFGKDTSPTYNKGGSPRQALLAQVKSEYGVTPDDVVLAPNGQGRLKLALTDSARDALISKTGISAFKHNLSAANASTLVSMLDGPKAGLKSTFERWDSGIGTNGMSSSADMNSGGADYVFTSTMLNPPTTYGYGYGGGAYVVVHPKAAMRNLDIYANPGDNYGRRVDGRDVYGSIKAGAHETLFKHGVPVSDFWYMQVPNATTRASVIEALKKRGITQINGVPIEQFIIEPGQAIPQLPEGNWDTPINPGPAGPAV